MANPFYLQSLSTNYLQKSYYNDRRKNEALERIAEVMNSNRIWKSKTRGSVYHYNNFFEDNLLREIADKTG